MAVYCIKDSSGNWREAEDKNEFDSVKNGNKNNAKLKTDGYDCDRLNSSSTTTTTTKAPVTTTTTTKTPLTPAQKEERAKKCGYKTWDEYKADGFKCKTPAPSPISSGYQDCTGKNIRFRGCKDTDGIINRVQGCLGVKQDNLFGPKTEEQLKLKTGLEYFTTDKVDAICSGKLTPDGTQQQVVRVQDPGTKEYWENLIKNKQITKQGLIIKTRLGYFIYVIKIDKIDRENPPSDVDFNTIKKYPISTIKEVDSTTLESYDYVSFYPISGGREEGAFAFLKTVPEMDGGEKVVVDTNFQGKWSPEPIDGLFGDEEKDMFSPLEETISKTIKKTLNEQRIKFDRPGQTNTGTSNTGNQTKSSSTTGAGTTPSGSGVTNVKPNPNDVKKVIEPIRLETIGLLNQIKENLKFKAKASPEDRKNLDDAITLLKNFDSSKACDNITLIDENLTFLNQMIKANEGGFGKKDIVDLAKQVRTNLQKVKSECQRLENEAVSKSSETTKPQVGQQTTTQPNSGQPKPNQNTMTNNAKTDGVQIEDKGYDRNTCRDKIKNLHLAAFPPALRRDKSNMTDEELPEIKKDILYCVTEFPFLSGVAGVKDEIKELLDCRTSKGLRKRSEGDTSEYRKKFCLVSPNYTRDEILHIKKELRVESVLKRNVGSLISEAVVAKRKEKTRDVIVEDILKSLRGH